MSGSLNGGGTLATVLCESLLSYLPTGMQVNQPRQFLKAYDVLPQKSAAVDSNRLDLHPHATTRGGILYIRRPALEKIWGPLGSLPALARATAAQMLRFLELLRGTKKNTIAMAAKIIVMQFKHDLFEMGVVDNLKRYDGDIQDGSVVETISVSVYVDRVFRPDCLPSDMSTNSMLNMTIDLFNERQLKFELEKQLFSAVKTIPKTTVHSRSISFSSTRYTLLLRGELLLGLNSEDAQRLVVAAESLVTILSNSIQEGEEAAAEP